jgi:phage tail protein X
MQSGGRRLAAAILGFGVASILAIPSASADLLEPGWKKIPSRFLLHAGRFDDYCEHRRTIEQGDTLESIAEKAYGNRARVADLVAANPGLDAKRLEIGRKVVLPAKRKQPSDAKETLAWDFWGYTSISGFLPLQRVYPDDPTDPTGSFFELFAVPAERAPEVAALLEKLEASDPNAPGLRGERVVEQSPFAIGAHGVAMQTTVSETSTAAESTTVVRIVELTPASTKPGRFVVESETPEFRDRYGLGVLVGFEQLLSWRGIPLAAVALIGAVGLFRMRRVARGRSREGSR